MHSRNSGDEKRTSLPAAKPTEVPTFPVLKVLKNINEVLKSKNETINVCVFHSNLTLITYISVGYLLKCCFQ